MADLDAIRGGVGMNLRLRYLDALLARPRPEVAFWEVIAENLLDNPAALEKACDLRRHTPISLHCVGMNLAGTDPLDRDYLARIRHLIEVLDPVLVSDHLCWQKHGGIHHHDLLPFPLTNESAHHVAQRVVAAQDHLGHRIAVENLAYYVEFHSSTRSEASLLNELAHKTGCGLILDLNNIEVNDHNLGQSADDFVAELDLSHVVELHVAGGELISNTLVDTHGTPPTHTQIQRLCEHPHLRTLPACYERDNHIPPLEESLEIVRALTRARSHLENHSGHLQLSHPG